MIAQSLLDFILSLLRDPQAQQEFRDDPGGTLGRHGFGDLCSQDVADALPLVIDNSRVSFDRSYDTGNNTVSVHTVVPPPPSPCHLPGECGLDAVVRQFDYITNTYVYTDSHDTVLDNSVNQNIWAHGDVFQLFDNDPVVASGDGAVAAGDDINGDVTTGDHNVVGNGNDVSTGDGATSFGNGDAYNFDDLEANGDGSAVAVDGNATGSADDNSTDADLTNFGAGNVAFAGTNGAATVNDIDSHNDSHNDSHDDIASHNDVDSHDDIASNNDIASHNDVDSHDDINSHNDVLSNNDVNSNNDVASHNDIASHNSVDVVPI